MGIDDKKEGQSLREYMDEDEGEDIGYIPLLFITAPPLRTEWNRLTDMGEGIRSINHLVCIPKISLLYNY